jgi:dipeptidyl aminopeptidase/acylaminoacyl peptidase
MITKEENILLNIKEYNFIKSGWGQDVADNINLRKILYESENEEVEGYIATPKFTSGKLPVIIWNRGGFKESGKLDNFLAFGLLGEIASWGYAVFASQYRENDEFGGSDLNDVTNILTLAEKSDYVNSDLIGMEGWSRGGLMTYLALTKTNKIKCAVIISGIADLNRNINNIDISKIFSTIIKKKKISTETDIKKRSAIDFYKTISKNTSILLIHGDKDEQISHLDSIDMFSKLSGNKYADYEIKIIQGGDHFLKASKKEVSKLRKNWFAKYLR